MLTRNGAFPKYGAVDRFYGGPEHDGFQDTFNTDVRAMTDWGLFGRAAAYIDNYLSCFVRDDGSIVYRGPETGQYGRMLANLAHYARCAGDDALLIRHRGRIDAITRLLLDLRTQARRLPADDPAHGLIRGWCEADSCLETDPGRYVLPYYSNSRGRARPRRPERGMAADRLSDRRRRAGATRRCAGRRRVRAARRPAALAAPRRGVARCGAGDRGRY
jgi:hypothetical protein